MARTVCGRSVVARVGAIRIALSIAVVLSHVSIAVPQVSGNSSVLTAMVFVDYVWICE